MPSFFLLRSASSVFALALATAFLPGCISQNAATNPQELSTAITQTKEAAGILAFTTDFKLTKVRGAGAELRLFLEETVSHQKKILKVRPRKDYNQEHPDLPMPVMFVLPVGTWQLTKATVHIDSVQIGNSRYEFGEEPIPELQGIPPFAIEKNTLAYLGSFDCTIVVSDKEGRGRARWDYRYTPGLSNSGAWKPLQASLSGLKGVRVKQEDNQYVLKAFNPDSLVTPPRKPTP